MLIVRRLIATIYDYLGVAHDLALLLLKMKCLHNEGPRSKANTPT
jgi:hypothetical protein